LLPLSFWLGAPVWAQEGIKEDSGPKTKVLLIWGGTKENASQGMPSLDRESLRKIVRKNGLQLAPDMPQRIRSTGVEGLNPGFVIDVIGACESETQARLILRALRKARPGLYFRKVVSSSFENSCPETAVELAQIGTATAGVGQTVLVKLACQQDKADADGSVLDGWENGKRVWLMDGGNGLRAHVAEIIREEGECPVLRLSGARPFGRIVAVSLREPQKTWKEENDRIITEGGLEIQLATMVVKEDIHGCKSGGWEGDCIVQDRVEFFVEAKESGGREWLSLWKKTIDKDMLSWKVLGDINQDGVPEIILHVQSYPDAYDELIQLLPRARSLLTVDVPPG